MRFALAGDHSNLLLVMTAKTDLALVAAHKGPIALQRSKSLVSGVFKSYVKALFDYVHK